MTLKQPSQISTVAKGVNNPSLHPAIISDLKHRIKDVIDSPSFNQLIHSGANVKETQQLLAVLISKYANMLTVGGNLHPEHPLQYAKEILEDWSTMSLDDFNILLSRGVKGRYNEPGKLFRFDISVIYEWIAAYQDEFWEVKESQLKQKSALEMIPDEKLVEIQEAIKQSEGIKPILPLTEKDIRLEGQEKPKKPAYHQPDISFARTQELRMEYGRTCRDLHTGKPLPGKPETFEEYLKTI